MLHWIKQLWLNNNLLWLTKEIAVWRILICDCLDAFLKNENNKDVLEPYLCGKAKEMA